MSRADFWPEVRHFLVQVAIALAAAAVVLAYPVYLRWGPDVLAAAAVGCAISTLNVVLGGVSVVWAFDKPQPVFLKTVLGGMALRMVGVCVSFILLIRLSDFPIYGLAVSMFLFYLLYQVLEIRFLTARNAQQAQEGR